MLFGLVCANVRSEANSTHLIINRLVVSVGCVRKGGPPTKTRIALRGNLIWLVGNPSRGRASSWCWLDSDLVIYGDAIRCVQPR
jgi:hypothetical protein